MLSFKRYFDIKRNPKILLEMDQATISDLQEALSDAGRRVLPFNEMFGNKLRFAEHFELSVVPEEYVNLERFINLGFSGAVHGYRFPTDSFFHTLVGLKFDFNKGVITIGDDKREFKINRKLRNIIDLWLKFNNVKTVDEFLKKNSGTSQWQSNVFQASVIDIMIQILGRGLNPAPEKDWTIIYSRAPVDVLRMSDFSTIQSCHSMGGDFFKCAIDEAKGGGAIAYLIPKKDYTRIENKLDLTDENIENYFDEIFKDDDRNVRGVTPFLRLRIRSISLKKNPGHLYYPIPEIRIYGSAPPSISNKFLENVREKCKDYIPDDMDTDLIKYKLHGGTYEDNKMVDLLRHVSDGKFIHNIGQGELIVSFEKHISQLSQKYDNIGAHAHVESDEDAENGVTVFGDFAFYIDVTKDTERVKTDHLYPNAEKKFRKEFPDASEDDINDEVWVIAEDIWGEVLEGLSVSMRSEALKGFDAWAKSRGKSHKPVSLELEGINVEVDEYEITVKGELTFDDTDALGFWWEQADDIRKKWSVPGVFYDYCLNKLLQIYFI